jgi:hypothetical protein
MIFDAFSDSVNKNISKHSKQDKQRLFRWISIKKQTAAIINRIFHNEGSSS